MNPLVNLGNVFRNVANAGAFLVIFLSLSYLKARAHASIRHTGRARLI